MQSLKNRIFRFLKEVLDYYLKLRSYRIDNGIMVYTEELSIDNKSCFFGYHDLDPALDEGRKILAHVYSGKANDPFAIQNEIEVGFFEKKAEKWEFNKIGTTSAWCWQQGARLQKLNNSLGKTLIFYNIRLSENSFGGIAFDIDNNSIYKTWDEPFNVISNTGKLGGVLNYGLLGQKRPGYGYHVNYVNPVPFIKVLEVETDKVLYELIFGNEIAYINHMHFSPDDKYLIYFKFNTKSSVRKPILCIVDLELGELIYQLPTNIVCSHFTWLNEKELIISSPSKLYWKAYRLSINCGVLTKLNYTFGDFHPFKVKGSTKVIFDSYPENGKRNLYSTYENFIVFKKLFDFDDDTTLKGEYRVDLHPRFCHDLNSIHVDVGVNSYRKSLLISGVFKK